MEKVNDRSFIDGLIHKTISRKLKWKFVPSKKDEVYTAKWPITDKKYIYMILTRRDLDVGSVNLFLEAFITTQSRPMIVNPEVGSPPELPGYYYSTIRTFYLSGNYNLIRLYAYAKYRSYLKMSYHGKEYANNLLKWSKAGLITWYMGKGDSFVCYDITSNNRIMAHNVKSPRNLIIELTRNNVNILFGSEIVSELKGSKELYDSLTAYYTNIVS